MDTKSVLYWIAIQCDLTYPPQYGWMNTDGLKLNYAQQGFYGLSTPFWTALTMDMAFYLTGISVGPPPKPKISCEGNLLWEKVKRGATVNATFRVVSAIATDPLT
jgi:hypothetical protein